MSFHCWRSGSTGAGFGRIILIPEASREESGATSAGSSSSRQRRQRGSSGCPFSKGETVLRGPEWRGHQADFQVLQRRYGSGTLAILPSGGHPQWQQLGPCLTRFDLRERYPRGQAGAGAAAAAAAGPWGGICPDGPRRVPIIVRPDGKSGRGA